MRCTGDSRAGRRGRRTRCGEEIGRAVAAANSTVSRSESIRVFRILPEPFDLANGMLTPSMKLRRDTIVRRYEAEIEAMYATSARAARRTASEELAGWDDSDSDNVFRRARH